MALRWNFEREVITGAGCIAACVLLALISSGKDATRRAMDSTAAILAPVEKPFVYVLDQIEGFRRWTSERRSLLEELEHLRREKLDLRIRAGEESIERMKAQVRPGNRLPVVFRAPGTWWEELRISTGNKEIQPGTAVLDGADLVGFVVSQKNGNAWVRLITSSNFSVPAVVEETREIGVVTGDDEGGVWLRYLPSEGVYTPGMKVLTVLGSRLPAGLFIGVITNEQRSVIPGINEYRLRIGADIFRLQYLRALEGNES